MFPELELGVVLLTNGSSSAARSSVMNTIVRSFMPVEPVDWLQMALEEREAEHQEEEAAAPEAERGEVANEPCCVADMSQFTGLYRDPWFGDVSIAMEDGQLVFSADKSPVFKGILNHHDGNRFVVRWIDRTLEADAYVLFEAEPDGKVTAISMTKLDNGDFDFEDLQLTRIE
jgi:hypothetical protein